MAMSRGYKMMISSPMSLKYSVPICNPLTSPVPPIPMPLSPSSSPFSSCFSRISMPTSHLRFTSWMTEMSGGASGLPISRPSPGSNPSSAQCPSRWTTDGITSSSTYLTSLGALMAPTMLRHSASRCMQIAASEEYTSQIDTIQKRSFLQNSSSTFLFKKHSWRESREQEITSTKSENLQVLPSLKSFFVHLRWNHWLLACD